MRQSAPSGGDSVPRHVHRHAEAVHSQDLQPREWIELSVALALLTAAVVFGFALVPDRPYLAPVPLAWMGAAVHFVRLGHVRRSR